MPDADSNSSIRAALDTADHFHTIASQFDDLYEAERRSALRRWLDSRLRASIYRRFELVFEQLGDLRGKSVLDVGCGGGRYSVTMGKLGAARVVGVDFAERMIDLAEALLRQEGGDPSVVSFVRGDALEVEFDEKFDYGIAMGVFDYVKDAEGFLRTMLGKVELRFVASFPVKWNIWTPQRRIRYQLFKKCPLYFYTRSDLDRLMGGLGLRSYEVLGAHRDYVVVMDL